MMRPGIWVVLLIAFVVRADNCPPANVDAQEITKRVAEINATASTEMQSKEFSSAAGHFAEAVCLAPNNPQQHYLLGIAQAGNSDFLAARKSLATASRLTPGNPLPLAMLVRVNLSMGDIDSAKATLREIGQRFPKVPEIHATLAKFLNESQQPDLALAEALRAREPAKNDAEAAIELTVLEYSAGAYEDALRNAKAIVDRQTLPASARAAAAGIAGLSSESMSKRDDAITYLRRSIELDPNRENSYLSLAFLYEKALNYRAAVEILETGQKQLPGSTALLPALGTDLIRAQEYQAGVAVLAKAIAANAEDGEAYLHLADGYRQLTDSSKEIEMLRALAKSKNDYPMIHILIARAILNASEPDAPAALSELQEAEKSTPADPQLFYLRGKAYSVLGKNEEAVPALQRAIELAPGDSGPYYQLARLYQKMGKQELAREMFQRTTTLQRNQK